MLKRNALLMGIILIAMASPLDWAAEMPARQQEYKFSIGFAIGKGFVENSDSELFAVLWRLEFRRKRMYVATRGSRVAQNCSTRPNPTEWSLLTGVSFPLKSNRNRLNIGIGVGMDSVHSSTIAGLPCELRLKIGVFELTAFSNFNRVNNFYGVCAGFIF